MVTTASGKVYGFVYFIQADSDGLIKIGWTNSHPDVRLLALRLASPQKLRPLGVIRSPWQKAESDMHLRFGEFREHGEWFRPEPPLLQFIQKKAKRWPRQSVHMGIKEPTPERMQKAYQRQLNDMIDWALSVEKIRRRVRAEKNAETLKAKRERERTFSVLMGPSTG